MIDYILIIRIILSIVLGFAIGIERQMHKHDIGIRTTSLISAGSCLATIISIVICNDPGRIAAQIVSGVGFIGAGIIWKTEDKTYGLTTAVVTWVTAIIGISCGCGLYMLSICTTIFIILILIVFNEFKKK